MKTLARLDAVREIRERMLSLAAEDERRWGSMSVGEMVCHVRGAFELTMGEQAAERLAGSRAAPIIKFFALRVPMRWPQGMPTLPELRGSEMMCGCFGDDKAEMVRAFERFLLVGGGQRAHPIFGSMRPADWMRWGYLHTDHHLRQFGR